MQDFEEFEEQLMDFQNDSGLELIPNIIIYFTDASLKLE